MDAEAIAKLVTALRRLTANSGFLMAFARNRQKVDDLVIADTVTAIHTAYADFNASLPTALFRPIGAPPRTRKPRKPKPDPPENPLDCSQP